ncbi:hypothetical protein AAMO2058_001371900 [Amorphochlora amoebiformis]
MLGLEGKGLVVRKRKRKLEALRPTKINLDDMPFACAEGSPLSSLDTEDATGEVSRSLKQSIIRITKIDVGATSVVYLAMHAGTMRLVAVKERKLDNRAESLMRELHELHENLVPIDKNGAPQWIFNHYKSIGTVHPCKHILSYYGSFADPEAGTINLCLEYMDSGSLERVVKAGGVRDERVLQHISHSVLRALDHLQEFKTVHNDIKPANILVSHNGDVKVGDLGLACQVSGMSEVQGTLAFFSPERFMSQPHSFPADIWALGITLIAVATGKMPFEESTGFFHLEDMVVNKPIPGLMAAKHKRNYILREDGILSKIWSPKFMTFVTCMLIKDPKKRHPASQLLEHQFLKSHNANDFQRPDGKYHPVWTKRVGTRAVDGKQLLPAITTALRKHISNSGGVLCAKTSSPYGLSTKKRSVSVGAYTKIKREKAEFRWKKLKTRFLHNAHLNSHPFVGVWKGVVNLAKGLQLPTRTVGIALGLVQQKEQEVEGSKMTILPPLPTPVTVAVRKPFVSPSPIKVSEFKKEVSTSQFPTFSSQGVFTSSSSSN